MSKLTNLKLQITSFSKEISSIIGSDGQNQLNFISEKNIGVCPFITPYDVNCFHICIVVR